MKLHLSGNASGYYDNLDTIESLVEFVRVVAVDLGPRRSARAEQIEGEITYLSRCVNVTDIGGNPRSTTNIV